MVPDHLDGADVLVKDFTYYTPTEVVFGRGAEEHVAELVRKHGGHKILVHYGGGSAKRSGLLDKICGQLTEAGIPFVTLGGVVPNPRLSLVHEGIELCRREGIDLILAIGGGSAIDSSKAIAYGVPYAGDVWDFFCGKAKPAAALPVGCVVTNPASGSEMSDSCVITNEETMDKRGYSSPLGRCRFAVSNPERTFTLPPYQTAAGVTDIMMHTMERYFSNDMDMDLTEALAEALLRTLKENASKALANPSDYGARTQIMWGGSLAHNGLTECGMQRDWACHKMEHELSAMFDVTHGAGLSALWPAWARYVYKSNVDRFVRFAVRVMGIPAGAPEETALRGIEAMEQFYREIGMPVNTTELLGRPLTDAEIEEMARRCSHDGAITVGNLRVLTRQDMAQIYKNSRA